MRFAASAATLAALAVALAPAAAEARRRPRSKASGIRPEENPALLGDSKKFAGAQVRFAAPAV